MKKLLALILALVMLFSLTACQLFVPSDDNCTTGHVDEDGDEKCDRCGADVPKELDPDKNDPDAYLAPTISEAIIAQINAASSLKVDMTISLDVYDSVYHASSSEADINLEKNENRTKGDITVSLTLSKTEDGFNAILNLKSVDTSDDERDTEEETLYVIDGSAYIYDEELGAYVETMIPSLDGFANVTATPAAITTMITSMLTKLEIPEEEQTKILSEVGTVITAIFDIVDKKGDFNIDFKPYIDDFFTYVNDINVETKTLESLINDALHLADPELDFADALAEIKRIAKLTLDTALAELDKWLVENTEDKLDLQGVYDTIVADERVEQLVRTYMGMLGVPEGEDPIDEEDIQAFLAELRAVKVTEFIQKYYPDLSAVTVYDALMPILSALGPKEEAPAPDDMYDPDNNEVADSPVTTVEAEEEPEYPTVGALFGAIEDFFAMTVAEAVEEYGMPDFITEIKSAISGITVNALSTDSSIAFTESFSLESLSIGAKIDVATAYPNGYDATKTDEHYAKIDFKLSISSISDKTVEITLPEGAKTIFGIFNVDELFTSEDGIYELNLYWPSKKDGKFIMDGELYASGMWIDISMEMPTEKQESYVFDYTFYPNDSDTVATGKLTIVFDYDNYTYRVIMGTGE